MEEIWKNIPNYENIYQVSNLGRVKSLDKYVNYLYKTGLLELPTMTKKFKNGKTIKTTAVFNKQERVKGNLIMMYPYWDNQTEENLENAYLYDIDDLP